MLKLMSKKPPLLMFHGDGSQKFGMRNVNLQTSPFERDLGVVISEDLSRFEQTKTRCNKAYRAFSNLKRNTSPLNSLCHAKYVFWVCRTNFETLFSILACRQDIHERTRTGTEESNEMVLQNFSSRLQNPFDATEAVTNLYIEMHDSITYCKIVADQYNFDRKRHITPIEKSSLRTTTSSPFYLPKIRRGKSKDNFWYRTLQLHRRLSRTVNLQELCYVRECIQDYYWKFFICSSVQYCEQVVLYSQLPMLVTSFTASVTTSLQRHLSWSTTFVKKTCAHGESTVNVEPVRHEVTGICVGSVPFRWRNQLLLLLSLSFLNVPLLREHWDAKKAR